MVGADLRNLVNEAALRRRQGGAQGGRVGRLLQRLREDRARHRAADHAQSHEERERTAYHEGGHALLGMLEPGADPVRKVSIVPRGRALGVTFQSPESDRYGYDTAYLLGRIVGALGGRAAEEIVYGSITTGAESDLQQVTPIARSMVGRWGMSDADRAGHGHLRRAAVPGAPARASEATRELIDQEVRRIVEECYARAVTQLRENRERLDGLARELLARETLDEGAAYARRRLRARQRAGRPPAARHAQGAVGDAARAGPAPAERRSGRRS